MTVCRTITHFFAFIAISAALSIGTVNAQEEEKKAAEGSVERAVTQIAQRIANRLKQAGELQVAIGGMRGGPTETKAMRELLVAKLQSMEIDSRIEDGKRVPVKLVVSEEATWKVFAMTAQEKAGRLHTAIIDAELKDFRGRAAGRYIEFVTEQDDIRKMFNLGR